MNQRWTAEAANEWYAKQKFLMGGNYVPANAINQIEMWQEETYDPARIDLELGWAEKIGMNTMRVFLHDLVWQQDGEKYIERIDNFLSICERHNIRPMLVLFDSVWDPFPKTGPQREPVPGVHNSGWVQGPGAEVLKNLEPHMPRLKDYVQGVVGAFANDPRVLAWDMWNEPDNTNGAGLGGAVQYGTHEPKNKSDILIKLLPQVFDWARAVNPKQPLTCGIWIGNWSNHEQMEPLHKLQVELSDVVSFHNYDGPQEFETRVTQLQRYGRPLLCTEYMARGRGSTFEDILPLMKKFNVAAYNWGFVAGKSQTHLPWDSWKEPYVGDRQPNPWFHDIFDKNGTPYRPAEVEFIKSIARPGL